MDEIRSFLETVLLFLVTFLLYFLFVLTAPIFREPHGLLAVIAVPGVSQALLVKVLLFFSASLCVLQGVLMMQWVPILAPGVMANLFGTTFFFMWIDPVLALSEKNQSLRFVSVMGIGLVFIYLFFFTIHLIAPPDGKLYQPADWKSRMVPHFFWGWMGFYFGLSVLLSVGSLRFPGFRLPLSFGALGLCFLYYLLILHLKKTEGKETGVFSKIGRWVFTLWFLGLAGIWIGEKWTG